MNDIEDNVSDSDLRKMWKAGHVLVDTTRTKIDNGLKKYGLDKVPVSIEEMRQYVIERRKKERGSIDGWKFLQSLAVDVAKKIDNLSK